MIKVRVYIAQVISNSLATWRRIPRWQEKSGILLIEVLTRRLHEYLFLTDVTRDNRDVSTTVLRQTCIAFVRCRHAKFQPKGITTFVRENATKQMKRDTLNL
jgi:hypothetical protein